MDLNLILYYLGFLLAIFLCRGLGTIFAVPMALDLLFNLALNFGLFAGWDIRLVMMVFGFGIFLWVLALSGAFTKTTFVAVLLMDLTLVFTKVLPSLQAAGAGPEFWNATSTGIVDVWMLSAFVVVVSMAIRSTVIARYKGKFVDLLTNPKKRFLLPLGAWAGIIVLGGQFASFLPAWLVNYRFNIAAHVLVWGWVATELPFYIQYQRLKRRYVETE